MCHAWKRGITNHVVSGPPKTRWTKYKCAICELEFLHYYRVQPDIHKAMMAFIPNKCVPPITHAPPPTARTDAPITSGQYVELHNVSDVAYANRGIGAYVSRETFPSGLRMPPAPVGKVWVIRVVACLEDRE